MVTAMMNAEYLSPYYYSNSKIDKSDSFVVNANIGIKVLKTLDLYLAIDNLFNAVKYSSSYPCAGTKIRIGGNWKF
jgi:outer membrane receptor protein involved in Fe transport